MAHRNPITHLPTHSVSNQPPPLEDYNAFNGDAALKKCFQREGATWTESMLRGLGANVGSAHVIQLGCLANDNIPQLKTHDRFGQRIDEVDYHPAYHQLLDLAIENQVHSIAWTSDKTGGHVAHAASIYLLTQAEAGVCCPLAMTYAAIPSLRHQPEVAAEWEPRLLSNQYDPRSIPAAEKKGATIGMAMTEKQGGSDVRANTTKADPIETQGSGHAYRLNGHKWFCSAPMSDAFLTLAHTKHGLSCFLVPRWLPDGSRNRFFIQRLKNKLGNRSNASSEIEYADTWAQLVGEEGGGVRTIIDMVHHTRLDAAAAGAGLMRAALTQAIHHAANRSAFQRHLIDQPAMRNVLADLAIESEAATVLLMRIARAFDDSQSQPAARLFARIATAAGKYWINKRAPNFVYEALECLGGGGYVEESLMPRLYREAPLNSIWEGTGNVICLDVLRAMIKEPETINLFLAELEAVRGHNRYLDSKINAFKNTVANLNDAEADARRITETMALTLQGALLAQYAPEAIANIFCESRLGDDWGRAHGTLPKTTDFKTIIERARPKLP